MSAVIVGESDRLFLSFQNLQNSKQIRRIPFFQNILEGLGRKLRDWFYLPLNKKVDQERQLNQRLAERISDVLKNQGFFSKKIESIKEYFNIKDVEVSLEDPYLVKTFKVRVFESKKTVRDKNLRIILFTFNGNTQSNVEKKSSERSWDPLSIEELSQTPLRVMQAFQKAGVCIDSLMTHSLGNVALDSMENISSESIPKTLVINRGFTSTKKVGNQICPFPLNYILYGMARLCGWTTDPESGLLKFLAKDDGSFQRKIVIIEALKDFYLSEKGALDPFYHDKISKFGASVFRAKYWPYPFHSRSHHALSLNHLVNNSQTQVLANSPFFTVKENEKMSTSVARNIFLNDQDDCHTCFCIGGADSTIEVGTVREVIPLLSAFINFENKGAL